MIERRNGRSPYIREPPLSAVDETGETETVGRLVTDRVSTTINNLFTWVLWTMVSGKGWEGSYRRGGSSD